MKGTVMGKALPKQAKALIEERLVTEMLSTPLHRVRVTHLCRKCGLNRSSFYEHFDDIYDAARSVEEGLLEGLDEVCRETHERDADDIETSLAFLEFFETHRHALRALLPNETSARLFAELDERLHARFLLSFGLPEADALTTAVLRFASAGYYRLYLDLVWEDGPVGPEGLRERARIAARFCSGGLASSL